MQTYNSDAAAFNVWVGTNLGLYKVPVTGEVLRYAEEGIEGFEIPDNLVEHLFADEASNVWALLPEQMAFIPSKTSGGDVPAYAYPGKNAAVFSIFKLPLSETAFLLATAQGLMYMHGLNGAASILSGEIYQSFHETAFVVPDAVLEKPSELADVPVLSVHTLADKTWFVTSKGLWHIPTKKLLKQLQRKS